MLSNKRRLSESSPQSISKVMFRTSGSEAVRVPTEVPLHSVIAVGNTDIVERAVRKGEKGYIW
jgi:hypothetical protein